MRINSGRLNLEKLFHIEAVEKTTIILLSCAVFIIFTIAVSYVPFRFDLSQGKAYTLSRASRNIIDEVDGVATIKLYISSDLPAHLNPLKTDVVDFIDEYRRAGHGKIVVKILDPKKDLNAKQEVTNLKIPELQFSQVEKDKYAVSTSFFGIGIFYKDKHEVILQATNIANLEYDVSASLYKMVRKKIPKIAMIGDGGQSAPVDELSTLKQVLKQQFSLESFNEATSSSQRTIESSFDTVMLFDTGRKYDDTIISALKKYLDHGGKVIAMVDGILIGDAANPTASVHNLFSLFDSYDIILNKDLVLSSTSEVANFSNGQVVFFAPYPFWVKTALFDHKRPEFANVRALVFPWVSSVMVATGSKGSIVVRTQKNSWTQRNNFVLAPNSIPPPKKNELSEFSLVAETTTPLDGRLMLIPSSRFVRDRFLSSNADNIEFILNVTNSYASGGALSGIRSRAISVYPIGDVDEKKKDIIKYGNMLLLPGLFASFGLLRLSKRRS